MAFKVNFIGLLPSEVVEAEEWTTADGFVEFIGQGLQTVKAFNAAYVLSLEHVPAVQDVTQCSCGCGVELFDNPASFRTVYSTGADDASLQFLQEFIEGLLGGARGLGH